MTEQTAQQTPAVEQAPEDAIDWQARREEQDRAMLEAQRQAWKISDAWESPEAAAVGDVVRADGNVGWRDFVSHVGGILKVLELVDESGRPDTRRIIPLVDDLFDKHYGGQARQMAGGMTLRVGPRNRPYPHRRLPVQAAGGELGPADAERMLREEAEAKQQRAVWSRGR